MMPLTGKLEMASRNFLEPFNLSSELVYLQDFIENNEGFQSLVSLTACTSLAEFQQFFQSDQFSIEVRDAMRQVVCSSHAGEHSEAGNLQMVGKDRHSCHR